MHKNTKRQVNSLKKIIKITALMGAVVIMATVVEACSKDIEEANLDGRKLSKPLSTNRNPRILSIGHGFSIAVRRNGTVWSWGKNHRGVLMRPMKNKAESYLPAETYGLSGAVSVAAADCILVLKNDGTVWSWGRNSHGQLGYETHELYSDLPRQIPGLMEISDISTYAETSLALKRDGTVWVWGRRIDGKKTDNGTDLQTSPKRINGLKNIVRIEIGAGVAYAIDESGSLWSFGVESPRLGREISSDKIGKESLNFPGKIFFPNPVVDISAKGAAVYALLNDGTVWSWGTNYGGELGVSSDRSLMSLIPRKVNGVSGVVAIASSDGAAVVTEKGEIVIWGVSGGAAPPPAPKPRHDLMLPSKLDNKANMPILSLVGGFGSYAYVDESGGAWYWKANNSGQRGTGLKNENPTQSYWMTPEKSIWEYK